MPWAHTLYGQALKAAGKPTIRARCISGRRYICRRGINELARQELQQLVRGYPSFSEAHAALATVFYRLKRPDYGDRETAEAHRVREEEPAKS